MAYRCQYESSSSDENDTFSNLVSRRDILQGIDSGRLIGAIISKLEQYHATLSIPISCSRKAYVERERKLIVAVEYFAAKSMENAVKELRSHAECRCCPLAKQKCFAKRKHRHSKVATQIR